MTATIRTATPADIPTLLGFIRALAEFEKLTHCVSATEADLHNSLFGANAKAYALIAEIAGQPVGFCIYFYNFSTFLGRAGIYIEDIFVAPEHRSRGIGQQFFRYLAAKLKAENGGRLEWAVLDWNQRAIDFYKSLGAETLDEWITCRLSGEHLHTLAHTQAKEVA